ncbi:hypothetical protein COV20_04230 [Candidatus Woesearchaeota archaeon CG10_big_fil_rev_8_21_14_0_10_45_16]|nr:MAG: hypothetical protein COV20_04230 [Candidatus Woesearchaeota archaeon CG10_big_fil_rev_8_21_14_0_10_45_16]
MFSERRYAIFNVALILAAVLLALNLFNIHLPSVGQAQSFFDTEEPSCLVDWQGEQTQWYDLDSCCLQARKQLSCEPEVGGWDCGAGSDTVHYVLNDKAYRYCQRQSFWP